MQQVYKDIVALAVGDDNGNSLIGTLRAILVLVSMPPRPKLDLEVCM